MSTPESENRTAPNLEWPMTVERLEREKAVLVAALQRIKRVYTPNGLLARDIDVALAKAGAT